MNWIFGRLLKYREGKIKSKWSITYWSEWYFLIPKNFKFDISARNDYKSTIFAHFDSRNLFENPKIVHFFRNIFPVPLAGSFQECTLNSSQMSVYEAYSLTQTKSLIHYLSVYNSKIALKAIEKFTQYSRGNKFNVHMRTARSNSQFLTSVGSHWLKNIF